jgi:hypothetical protein
MSGRRALEKRARRLRHYRRSLAVLDERLPDSGLVQELRDELVALPPELAFPHRHTSYLQ